MITFKLFHDARRKKVSGTYPVKVRITCDRRSKYYETGVSLTEEEFKPFNFPVFERRFLQKSYDGAFVETIYNEVINRFRQQDRIGTAENYKLSLRKLLKFKPQLRFEDVDATFLYKFEEWMLGMHPNTGI